MVVDYFEPIGAVARPHKTDTPLIVDADAVLPFSIILQCFEPVGRRYPQIIERLRLVQHEQLPQGGLLTSSAAQTAIQANIFFLLFLLRNHPSAKPQCISRRL